MGEEKGANAVEAFILSGNDAEGYARADELITLAQEKGAAMWGGLGAAGKGCLFIVTGKPADAVETITSGIAAYRLTGASAWMSFFLLNLAEGHAKLGRFEDAWRSIAEAVSTMKTSKEVWCEAEVNRIAGEIALKSPQPDTAKAEAHFGRALAVARQQQAKSWELRAAMSMSRLWRDQGKPQQARELLAPVYGWFTEGFNTHDLKKAKALLEELVDGI
jgi:predicted ATPase